ncbi:VanZ family protein [candidate division KSB1 bacterium]|nr:VanZ family protein [candidate division KSB1 bacterium]
MDKDIIHSNKYDEYRRALTILLLVTLCYMFILTLKPFEFSAQHLIQYRRSGLTLGEALFSKIKILDIPLNILFFIPLGLIYALSLKMRAFSRKIILRKVFIAGIGLSTLMEVSQLFLPRTACLTDILTNSLGAVIGGWYVCVKSLDQLKWLLNSAKPDHPPKWMTAIMSLYLLLITSGYISAFWLTSFTNWDSDFHLCVGNEATGDRPWEGSIYELAIYSKALTAGQIRKHFQEGNADSQNHFLIAHYIFKEDSRRRITDRSKLEPALDLSISTPNTVYWKKNQPGLHLLKGSMIKSTESARKLAQILKQTNELAIEIWLQPANVYQDGPARIVSLSLNTAERNFTLAQSGQFLSFRVRNPLTGENGSDIELYAETKSLAARPLHVVANYDHGAEQIFVDGMRLPERLAGMSDYIPHHAGFGRQFIGIVSLNFLLLFPLGWYFYYRKNSVFWRIAVTPLSVILPVIIPQIILCLLLGQPADFPLIISAGVTSIIFLIIVFSNILADRHMHNSILP